MSSNPSTIGAVEKQTTGENNATWGTLLNNAIDRLTEMGVGRATKSLTGSATLTTTNYSANESRWGFQVFTDGGLSGVPTVTFPAETRYWLVVNDGATYAVSCLAAGSGVAAVSIEANSWGFIYCDGTDMYVKDLSSMTGTLPLASLPTQANLTVLGNTSGGVAVPAAVSILDEDTMSSDSATALATQQSIKAYIDTIAAQGDLATVAGIAADITTVAGISANVTTTAGISAAVSNVSGISADVTATSGISADITTVAADGTDIGVVASDSADIRTLADIEDGTVATNAISNLAGISANVTTTAGISANVTTVAGISSDVTTCATNMADIQNASSLVSGLTASDIANVAAGNIVATDLQAAINELDTEKLGAGVSFTASGAISAGDIVALVSDGKVSAVSGTAAASGSQTDFEASSTYDPHVATCDSSTVVVSYRDTGNSHYGTAVVGSITGTAISYGTPVVFESAGSYDCAIAALSSTVVVIAYYDAGNSNHGTAIVGTVSGTSISFGSPTVFNATSTSDISICKADSDSVVIAYRDVTGTHGEAIVGTVSGTSISFGTAVTFESGNTSEIDIVRMSDTVCVIVYRDNGDSNKQKGIVGTVSGTSISFGSIAEITSGATYDNYLCKISSTECVLATRDSNPNLFVGTVSGTSITWSSAHDITPFTGNGAYSCVEPGSTDNTVVAVYTDSDNSSYMTYTRGTYNGTSWAFSSLTVIVSENVGDRMWLTHVGSDKYVMVWREVGSPYYGESIVFSPEITDAAAWIGVAQENISDTASGTITINGEAANLSGLTIGENYYVEYDGTLTTTEDNNSLIGRAVSATSILIKDTGTGTT